MKIQGPVEVIYGLTIVFLTVTVFFLNGKRQFSYCRA